MAPFKLTTNSRQVAQQIRAYRVALAAEAKRLPADVSSQGLTLLLAGIDAGVYNTPPGKYERTLDLKNKAFARPVRMEGKIGVELGSTSEHATDVEFGSLDQELNPTQARQLAEGVGERPGVLYLGRSGSNWDAPNPAITRAAVWSHLTLQSRFADFMRRTWR